MSVSGYIELTDISGSKVFVCVDHLVFVANVGDITYVKVVGHEAEFSVKESYEDIRDILTTIIRSKSHNPPPPPWQNREVKCPY